MRGENEREKVSAGKRIFQGSESKEQYGFRITNKVTQVERKNVTHNLATCVLCIS